MPEQEFEQRVARRLRDYSDGGLRPYDALEIARTAMAASGRRRQERSDRRMGVPAWFRVLVLAGLLVVLLVAAAFVGGLIQLPPPFIDPSPSLSPQPTVTGEPSATQSPASPTPGPSPSPSPSPISSPSPSPTPSPSPSPTPTPSPTPLVGWREIAGFPASQSDYLATAAYGPAGFVLVAVASPGGGNSWVSADGTSWTRSTDAGFDGAGHVVARGSEYIAIGTVAQGQGRRVWRSTDGLNWTLLTVSPVLEFVWDLTIDDGLLIAVGTNEDFDAARVWTSADGVSWTSIAGPEASSELLRVAARGGDIVALGDDFTGYGRVIWFRAAQSGEWVRYEPYGEDHDGRLVDLISNGLQFVAIGYEDDFDTGLRTPTIRSSVDGTNWTETRVSDSGVDVFEQVVVLPDGRLLAVGSSRNWSGSGNRLTMREVGYSYVSTDATTWGPRQQIWERTEQVGSDIGDQIERYRPVAAGGPGAIVADEDRPMVFFSPLADLR